MEMIVSPYHLTTREAPAMAALQIADRVVTMLPRPFSGVSRSVVEGAARSAPRYRDFIESWRWSAPLWDAGVITPTHEGFDASEDVRGAFERIAADAQYEALRPLMKPHVFETERDYLQAVAGDVLKGGPDPAITVPVAAGIDRFASRHGLAVARSFPTSVSQRAEARMGERMGALAVPVLTQASAGQVLRLRETLEDRLGDLRRSLEEALDQRGGWEGRVERSASAYTQAFESRREELMAADDPDEPRVLASIVSIGLVRLPGGAVLDSSVAAMRAMGASVGRRTPREEAGTRRGGAVPTRAGAGSSSTLPVVWDGHHAPVRAMVFKVIGSP